MTASIIAATRRCPKLARGPEAPPGTFGGAAGYSFTSLLSDELEAMQLEDPQHRCHEEDHGQGHAERVTRPPDNEDESGSDERRAKRARGECGAGVCVERRFDARRRAAEGAWYAGHDPPWARKPRMAW